MPLEDPLADNFNELEELWPTNGDGATVGNEHIQQLKRVLQIIFPDNGGPGQFDAPLFLGPDGTSTPTQPASVGSLSCEGDATIKGRVLANSQVAMASVKFDGAGAILGAIDGMDATTPVTRIAAGQYRLKFSDTGWDFNDLTVSHTVNNALLGAGLIITQGVSASEIDVFTVSPDNPSTPIDCATCEVVVFDRGRD